MPEIVEYCVGNVPGKTRSRLRDLPCTTIEKPCLQRCGTCVDGPVLVVDGEAIVDETFDDLIADVTGARGPEER